MKRTLLALGAALGLLAGTGGASAQPARIVPPTCERQARRIMRHQGVEVAVDEADQALPLAGRRHDPHGLCGGGARAGQEAEGGAEGRESPFHPIPPVI